jgi:hypothetical protein
MTGIQESSPPSPWDSLDACQQICELLDGYFGTWSGDNYSTQLDQRYRELWKRMTQPADTLPGFPSLGAFLDTLPPTLASLAHTREEWWLMDGKPTVVYLRGAMLTALEASGIAQPAPCEPPPVRETTGPDSSHVAGYLADGLEAPIHKKNNAASIRVAERRKRVAGLRNNGCAIKEIARELGTTERTISSDLAHLNSG